MPKPMILSTAMLESSYGYVSFLPLRTTLEDAHSHGSSQGSEHLTCLSFPHNTGWRGKRGGGLVPSVQGYVRIQASENGQGRLVIRDPGEQLWVSPGSRWGAMDANEDEQGQGCYEPDSWILCKSRPGRVTFRAGPTWGPAGACVVSHVLPATPGCIWEAQPEV